MREFIAPILLGSLVLSMVDVSSADAAKRKYVKASQVQKIKAQLVKEKKRAAVAESRLLKVVKVVERELADFKRDFKRDFKEEMKSYRDQIRGTSTQEVVSFLPLDAAIPEVGVRPVASENNVQVASLMPVGPSSEGALPNAPPVIPAPDRRARLFPATAVQRGQFRERRRTHKHAGLDLAGECGSPIVASYAGVTLPAPGGDRGYGPLVRVVLGDDRNVYRYAHMMTTTIKPGQRVATGETIGAMGKAGGRCHLHYEIIPFAEYRRNPYGVHTLDPNTLLGGRRGSTMTAGVPMTLGALVASASKDVELPAPPVAERTRIKRPTVRKRNVRHHRRHRAA